MRAENNWEEIGKRLRDLEATPPPLAWDKIKQDIKPRRKYRWWLWLPVLFALLGSLPFAYNKFSFKAGNISSEKGVAFAEKLPVTGKSNQQVAGSGSEAAPQPEVSESGKQIEPVPGNTAASEPASLAINKLNLAVNREPEQTVVHSTAKTEPKEPKKITRHGSAVAAVVSPGARSIKISETLMPEEQETSNSRLRPNTNAVVLSSVNSKPGTDNTNGTTETSDNGSALANSLSVNLPGKGEESSNADLASETAISNSVPAGNAGEGTGNSALTLSTSENNPTEEILTGSAAASIETQNGIVTRSEKAGDSTVNALKDEKQLPATDSAAKAPEEDKLNKENKPDRWAFTIYGTPQYAFQRVEANTEDNVMVLRMNNRNDFSDDRLGFEAGFRGNYKLTDVFGLEAGISLGKLQQHVSFTTSESQTDSLTVSQAGNGQIIMQNYNRERNQEFTSKYILGGLYLGGTYAAFDRLHFTAGVGSNWILSTQTTQASLKTDQGKLKPYVSAGLRYEMPVSPNFTLQAGPVTQYYLKPMQEKTTFLGSKPVTFGLFVGLKFNAVR